MRTMARATTAGLALGVLVITVAGAHDHARQGATAAAERQPVRITMEELHRLGGVPPGWRFRMPPGDRRAGRDVFEKLECFKCHDVAGETFPPVERGPRDAGPDLTRTGGHHPAEYLAQAVLDPNAVIVIGPGFTGPDGRSNMPSFADSLTVAELIDLVAYLTSLTGLPGHGGPPVRAQVVGGYRVRLEYHAAGQGPPAADGHGGSHHGAHATGGHAATPPGAAGQGHLMAFVTDATTGEPVPYLPVSATIQPASGEPRRVPLAPMIGGEGFHYGADVTVPDDTRSIRVTIAPTTIRVMPPGEGRYAAAQDLVFDWSRAPAGHDPGGRAGHHGGEPPAPKPHGAGPEHGHTGRGHHR